MGNHVQCSKLFSIPSFTSSPTLVYSISPFRATCKVPHTFFLYTQQFQTCDFSALLLLTVVAVRPLLCTEIDLKAGLRCVLSSILCGSVCPVSVFYSSSFLFFLLPLRLPPFRMGTVSGVIYGQLVIKLSEAGYGPKHCQHWWTYTFHLWYKSFVRYPPISISITVLGTTGRNNSIECYKLQVSFNWLQKLYLHSNHKLLLTLVMCYK